MIIAYEASLHANSKLFFLVWINTKTPIGHGQAPQAMGNFVKFYSVYGLVQYQDFNY